MTVVTTSGILLRSHPYSESSRVLRFLTPDLGIVGVLGRGTGRRSASRGHGPETFGEGRLTLVHHPGRDLHTLREYERSGAALGLGSDLRRFLGASLVAELLLAHALEQGDPALYGWVREVLEALQLRTVEELPGWILAAGWRTLSLLGFPPDLRLCVACGERHPDPEAVEEEAFERLDVAAGGLRCPACGEGGRFPRVGPTARRHLEALVEGTPPPRLPGASVHLAWLEAFTVHHLGLNRGLRTVAMLRPLLAEVTP